MDSEKKRESAVTAKETEARRAAKDTNSPGRLRGQRLLFETDFQGRLWGVQKGKGNK